MTIRTAALAATLALAAAPSLAQDTTEVRFGTNWRAQAEHGGFYQAVADGTYEACGLKVEILPGGPQVNNRALMIAGKVDFVMGGGLLNAFSAVQEGIPLKVVAAIFQKSPSAILSHPGEVSSFEELAERTHLVTDIGFQSYYQWLIAEKGFSAEKRAPYTFNPAPFLADKSLTQQGFVTSEPYAIEREAGFAPDVWLLSDHGYKPYSTTIETMSQTIEERPEVVECFVEGSILGWANYLHGDNAAANDLIKADNPDMTDDKIAFAIRTMKERGIVESGDAIEKGIGVVTPEAVQAFHDQMVEAGVMEPLDDVSAVFDASFVGKGVAVELRK